MEKTIKHKVFTYSVETKGMKADGSLGDILVERQARRGDTVDIPLEHEVARGESLGAFYTDQELEAIRSGGDSTAPGTPADAPGPGIDLTTASEEDVQVWLSGGGGASKPSVPQVLNAVNSVPEDDRVAAAEKVLDAEDAREGESRSTLVDPLEEFLKEQSEQDNN